MQPILAIDPGVNGGLAYQDADGVVLCHSLPKTERDIVDLLHSIGSKTNPIVYIEHIIPFSSFKLVATLMEQYGFLKGVCMSQRWVVEPVAPRVWQKPLRLGTKRKVSADVVNKSATKSAIDREWKQTLLARAQQLFPMVEGITLNTSDALLILQFAKTELRQ